MNFLKKLKFRAKSHMKYNKKPSISSLQDSDIEEVSSKIANPTYQTDSFDSNIDQNDTIHDENEGMYLLARHVETDSDSDSRSVSSIESPKAVSKTKYSGPRKIAVVSPTYQNLHPENTHPKETTGTIYQNFNNIKSNPKPESEGISQPEPESVYQNLDCGPKRMPKPCRSTHDLQTEEDDVYQNVETPIVQETEKTEDNDGDSFDYEPVQKPVNRPPKPKPKRPPPPNFAKRAQFAAERSKSCMESVEYLNMNLIKAESQNQEYLNMEFIRGETQKSESSKISSISTKTKVKVITVMPQDSPKLRTKSVALDDDEDKDDYLDMSRRPLTEGDEDDDQDDYVPMTIDGDDDDDDDDQDDYIPMCIDDSSHLSD